MAKKLLKYLPKPTSFSIPTGNINKTVASFSGPIVSLVPKEARQKKKSDAEAFDDEEPTSPKVSCIGQVKHKKSKGNADKNKSKGAKKKPPIKISQSLNGREEDKMRKKPSAIQRMFRQKVRPGRAAAEEAEEVAVAPVVGRMRKYVSGRETLGDFDWRTVVVAEEDEEEEVTVSYSGPILLGGGMVASEVGKKKEVNLWKRRTCAAPEPLQVN